MIVDKFYIGEHTPWSALSKGTFRMSSAEQCTRRAGYQFLKYSEDDESAPGYDDFRSVVLEEGNLQEVEVVRRIQQASRFGILAKDRLGLSISSKISSGEDILISLSRLEMIHMVLRLSLPLIPCSRNMQMRPK
ncbi:hypothetical protein LCGC14_2084030, partial [marine sediment metagenome]